MNFAAYFTPEASAWVVESLAHVLWQGTLAAVIAAAATIALRSRSAQLRYSVYCAAMLLTAACLPLNLWLLAPADSIAADPIVTVAAPVAGESTFAKSIGADAPIDASEDFQPPLAMPISARAAEETAVQLPSTVQATWSWAFQWIVAAYVAGIGGMAIRLLMGLYGSQRLRMTAQPVEEARLQQVMSRLGKQLCLKVNPVVAYSTRVTTPLVVGVIKPAILLPASILTQLSTEQVESLLMHELAHIRRYDHWVNLLQRTIETVLFFHPAVWWLSHKVSIEREHCCDDLAIRWGSEPCDYAETLVRLSEIRTCRNDLSYGGVAALAAKGNRPSQLQGRVRRVLGMPLAGPSIGLPRVGVVSLLIIAFASVAIQASWSDQNKSVDPVADMANVNEPGPDGATPLWMAVRFSKSERVGELLASGADPNIARPARGWTPLHCNAFCNSEPSCLAIGRQLLDHGADANVIEPTYGETPLHYAVRVAKSVALTKQLIDAGADVNAKSLKWNTPLQFAVSAESPNLVDCLLENGADPKLRNDAGFRPIDQINAIPKKAAQEIQKIFRKHHADDQRRPELIRKHRKQTQDKQSQPQPATQEDGEKPAETSVASEGPAMEESVNEKATISGKIVLEDGSPATSKGWLCSDTQLLNGNGASGTVGHFADKFSFQVGAGTTWISHFAEGYAPAWSAKLELSPGEHRDDILLVLKPGVSQRVKVVNDDGEAIPNATLVAYPKIHEDTGGPVDENQTDESGEYVLTHLANTQYSFRVEAVGYEPLRELHDLQPESAITLSLKTATVVTGVVLRESDRKPLAGAKIRLVHEANPSGPDRGFSDSRKSSWWGEEYATTDERGRFRLDRLKTGASYFAVIEAADGARAIVHGIESVQPAEILMPPRRDLVVNFTGDLGQLKKGSWAPRISVRQRFRFEPWPKRVHGQLLGGDVTIEATPGGGRAVLRGLAVDLNPVVEEAEEQKVEVYLPGNKGYKQTVKINPNGETIIDIELPASKAAPETTAETPESDMKKATHTIDLGAKAGQGGTIRGKVNGLPDAGDDVKYSITIDDADRRGARTRREQKNEGMRSLGPRAPGIVLAAGEKFEFQNVPSGECSIQAVAMIQARKQIVSKPVQIELKVQQQQVTTIGISFNSNDKSAGWVEQVASNRDSPDHDDGERSAGDKPNGDSGVPDEPQANIAPGPNNDPLRCRLIAVTHDSNDEAPDLTKQTNSFPSGDRLTFAVELTNASDKPITLLGTRYGDHFGESSGKLHADGFGPRLFEFEFFDAQGKPLPHAERMFVRDAIYLSGASTHELKPGQSHVVLLRPAQFLRPMQHRLPQGKFSARVTYRGASKETLDFVQKHRADQPMAKAWSGAVSSNTVDFTVQTPATRIDAASLVWGLEKDGLSAAIEFKAGKGVLGDPMSAPGVLVNDDYLTVFHLKNVSDRTITFVSETGRQGDELTVTDAEGDPVDVSSIFYLGSPIDVRWVLQPGEVAELDVLSPAPSSIKKPGEYRVQYTIRFNSRQSEDDDGNITFPAPGDRQGTLDTGVTLLVLRADDTES